MTAQTEPETAAAQAAADDPGSLAGWLDDRPLYFPQGSLARRTRLSPVRDVDLVADLAGARNIVELKSTTMPTSSVLEQALAYLEPLVHRYATSRLADDEAADRLTCHVLKTAGRSLKRDASTLGDLPAQMISIAARTANAWEDAARRTHATAPLLVQPPLKDYDCPASRKGSKVAIRYPDRAASRAVVVGAGSNPTAPRLPTADHSASAVAEGLAGTVAHPTVLRGEQATRLQVLSAVENAADEASDLLILYYAGHGQLDEGNRLSLGTADETVAFTDLYERTRRSNAAHVVFIVDACASGAASRALGRLDTAPHRRDEYVITATGQYEAALAGDPDGDHAYTAFTGALIDALTHGVPEGGDDLDIATLYSAVDKALARDTLPRPHLYAAGRTDECWALAPNPHSHSAKRRKPRFKAQPKPGDAQLVADAAHGNQDAWNELVERYSRLVWSTARAFRLNERECGAVFTDTWRLLLCDLEEVPPANLPRRLTEITRRRSVEALRSRINADAINDCSLSAATHNTGMHHPAPEMNRSQKPDAS